MCCVERLLYMSAAPSMLSVHLVTPTERTNFLEARAQRWTALSGRPLLVLLSSLFLYCFSFFFPTIQAAATGNQSFRDPQQVELSLPVSLSLWLPVDPHSSGTSKGSSGCCCVPGLPAPPGWFCLPSGNNLPSAAQTHLINVEVYGSRSSYGSCEELKACEVERVLGENDSTLRLQLHRNPPGEKSPVFSVSCFFFSTAMRSNGEVSCFSDFSPFIQICQP